MKKSLAYTLLGASIFAFWTPDTAYCECKKCKARAIELRKRLLDEERAKETKGTIEWDMSVGDDLETQANPSKLEKKEIKKKQRQGKKKKTTR